MALLRTYDDFLKRVNTLGFFAFSPILPGLPSLAGETEERQWHTGDPETDPWQWKDRAAGEKKLAFGCLLGGHKGFITEQLYPFFYAAYQPEQHMEERYHTGEINPLLYKLWQLFEAGAALDTGEIRRALGQSVSQSKADNAVMQLQKEFYITVSGNRRKINKLGEPYGWPSNTYQKVTDWVPEGWLGTSSDLSQQEAARRILETGLAMGTGFGPDDLASKLKLKTCDG